jgi:cytochrome d ubiquinol oxidase subunit I
MLPHRIPFAFTITYHDWFPQLTMGLALLIVVLETIAIRGFEAKMKAARKPRASERGVPLH